MDIKQMQERPGHGDISATNKYLHCIDEADEAADSVLQDMLITQKSGKAEQAVRLPEELKGNKKGLPTAECP